MVQSRGGHSSIVTATLEHSKKYVFQADVAVVINDWVAKHLKSRLLHTLTRYLYSGEGENIGTRRGAVELLELVVILLF